MSVTRRIARAEVGGGLSPRQRNAPCLGSPVVRGAKKLCRSCLGGRVCPATGKREVGYWIDRAFWGRGIATTALTAFLRLEQTRPLYAGVAKHNVASIRVLEKCGFVIDGASSEDDGATHILLKLDAKL